MAEGYTYVEVKVGPTQTKLEAVKGDRKVEVVYDNATNAIIKQEFEDADDDYVGRTGVEIETSTSDFEDDRMTTTMTTTMTTMTTMTMTTMTTATTTMSDDDDDDDDGDDDER